MLGFGATGKRDPARASPTQRVKMRDDVHRCSPSRPSRSRLYVLPSRWASTVAASLPDTFAKLNAWLGSSKRQTNRTCCSFRRMRQSHLPPNVG